MHRAAQHCLREGLVIPVLVTAFFASQGALSQFVYCTIQHNLIPSGTSHGGLARKIIGCLLSSAVILGLARILIAKTTDWAIRARRAVIFLAAAFYLALLLCFWADITRQDYIPYNPLLILIVTPLLLGAMKKGLMQIELLVSPCF